jgi:rifampicin phosphotransferase
VTGSDVVALEPRGSPRSDLGGKGGALDRLVGFGAPVPPTAVVTTGAYRRVAEQDGLAAYLQGVASAAAPPDADEVDRRFLDARVPGDLADAIVAAAARLGPAVAVRSSAWAEDLGTQSFAGQYRSFLDIPVEREALLQAVRLVWASLWHPAPWSYRRAWGIPDADASMAVVLMAMVPATHAGVAFTADPGGDPDCMRIEVVEGLGESLVSGARTPDAWLVPRTAGAPIDPAAPPMLGTVRDLACDLEARAGGPLDIEWAAEGERTWIVQARPVTVGAGETDGFDTPVDDHQLTSEGVAEMLPGVLPPLRWEVASSLVEEAFRSVLGSLRALPDAAEDHRFVRRVRGRAAMDLDLLEASARLIPGATEAGIERQYFGARTATVAAPSSAPTRQAAQPPTATAAPATRPPGRCGPPARPLRRRRGARGRS